MNSNSKKMLSLILASFILIATSFEIVTFAQCTTSTICSLTDYVPLNETFGTNAGTCGSGGSESATAYSCIVNMQNQPYNGGNNNTDAPIDGYYAIRCSNQYGWNAQWYHSASGMVDPDSLANGQYLVMQGGLAGSGATGYHPYEFYHNRVGVCPGATYTISFKAGNLSTSGANTNGCAYGGLAEIQLYAMPGGTPVQATDVIGAYNGAGGSQLIVTGGGTGGTGLGMTCSSTGFIWNTYSANYTVPAGQTSIDVVLLSSYLKAAGNDFVVDDIKVTAVSVPTGINSSIHESFEIYPNPSNDFFYVKINGDKDASLVLQLFDIVGQKMEEVNMPSGMSAISIGQNFSPGIYFLKLKGTEQKTIKLIKH